MNNKQFNLKVKEIIKKSQDEIVSECADLMLEQNLSYKQKKLIKRLQGNAHLNIIKETVNYLI